MSRYDHYLDISTIEEYALSRCVRLHIYLADCHQEGYDIGSKDSPKQPNQWIPDESLPGLRAFMSRFYWECFRVGGEILQVLAVGLDLDENNLLLKIREIVTSCVFYTSHPSQQKH